MRPLFRPGLTYWLLAANRNPAITEVKAEAVWSVLPSLLSAFHMENKE